MKSRVPSSWKIKDGFILFSHNNSADLVDIRELKRTAIEEKYAKDLLAIGMSLLNYPHDECHLQYLESKGFIVKSTTKEDPCIAKILRNLDSGFQWMLQENNQVRGLYEFALFLHSIRKEISVDYCQGPCLPETSTRRALNLHKRHKGGEVLLLGDDDLVSPLLAKLGTSVTVIDVHKNLLDFLGYINHTYRLNIETINHDITSPLPPHLCDRFAAAFGDPVGNAKWYTIFLSTAAKALEKNGLVYIVGYPRREELIQGILKRLGLIEQEVWLKFCHYYDEDFHHLPFYDADVVIARKTTETPVLGVISHENYNKYPQRPDMEYSYDFYDCEMDISEQTCLKHIIPRLLDISKIQKEDVLNSSRKNIIEFFLSSEQATIHLLGYKNKNYISLTIRIPLVTYIHYEIFQLINNRFKPARYLITELIRFIDDQLE